MTLTDNQTLVKKPLFNPNGDLDVRDRRMIGGNTTNLNDFNNMKYPWVSSWYRQAMNNFWIPEEINLTQDVKDYPRLSEAERAAYDKILSFLVFLDSLQSANLPNIAEYITANEVNLCLSIQAFQESVHSQLQSANLPNIAEYITANEVNLCLSIQAFQESVHSQSYSYMLDTICDPAKRNEILYQWKTDEHLLARNTFIGDLYNEFQERRDARTFLRVLMANYILEGVYFYSGFMFFYNLARMGKMPGMFFYNLARMGKMPGSAQEIRYINRDENTHLWLFRSIILELQKEEPQLFGDENVAMLREMLEEGVRQEIAWGRYVGCSAASSWSCRKKSRSCSATRTWPCCARCSRRACARKSPGAGTCWEIRSPASRATWLKAISSTWAIFVGALWGSASSTRGIALNPQTWRG